MLLRREDALLVIVDIQERLVKAMARKDEVVKNTGILAQAAQRLNVPVLATLQYPKGLGPLVEELEEQVKDAPHFEKLSFDCCGDDAFCDALSGAKRKQVVVTGMETHVCVLQTAMSLRHLGYEVHVVADAVCSRTDENKANGLERMRAAGMIVTNTESALFEMLGEAGTPEFKELSKLIR